MLIVTELGEAMEAYRKNNYSDIYIESFNSNISIMDFETFFKNTFEDELADVIIRLLDLCKYMKIDIEKHIELKMKYNESRPYKHGKIC